MSKPAETPLEIMVRCIRERDKRRYGKWITHNTAKGFASEIAKALSESGYALVLARPDKTKEP